MPTAIRISDCLAQQAKPRAKAMHRSFAGQVEYWAKIGQLAEENPDLPFSFIRDIMIGQQESAVGEQAEYALEDAQ